MNKPEKLFPRKVLPELTKYLDESGIILLVGARQSGKTRLLYLLIEELKKRGIPEQNINYFDLEDLSLLDIFNAGVKEFTNYLKAQGTAIDEKNYIFIDEIQYLTNPTNFLKLLADHYPNLKLIVSGSSTLEIRQKFKDSLAGRKVVFEVFPLDFYEFLIFKQENSLADTVRKSDLRTVSLETEVGQLPARFFSEALLRYFQEYLVFGGYPKVVLETEHPKKIKYLTDIYNSYVKKDIKDIMRVDNVIAFNHLLKALALQIGGLVNFTELCNLLKIARETLERYLFLLENTFIIKTVAPFSRNRRKEISKMFKIYFVDSGLRNIILKNLNSLEERIDAGVIVENGVYSNILKNLDPLEEIYFWRTLAKNEVDFVLTKGSSIKPIEVKYSNFKLPKVPIGIHNFQKDYIVAESVVLTKEYFGVKDKTIFLPVWLG